MVVESIRKMLFNYDAWIVYAKHQIDVCNNIIQLCTNDKRRKSQYKLFNARIDKEKMELFLQKMVDAKKEFQHNIDLILDKYSPQYKDVFLYHFIGGYSVSDVANKLGYSIDTTKNIIRKLNKDLLDMYVECC